jgi:hypothetical protein
VRDAARIARSANGRASRRAIAKGKIDIRTLYCIQSRLDPLASRRRVEGELLWVSSLVGDYTEESPSHQ